MKSAVDIFAQLGERLATFGTDARSSAAISAAVTANSWFMADEIVAAAEALRSDMLQRDKLTRWLSAYDFSHTGRRRVAIVMAGNIPLVGFFDLMCVIASGHTAVVKPSGKDRVLIEYIIDELRDIEPEISVEICDEAELEPINADAVIATGSDNARRHFKAAFAGKQTLLRGNRHSVAVLSGNESPAELRKLQSDIFSYSGLGCRNVSMIFVPEGYGLRLEGRPSNPKFFNNYLQNRALLLMRNEPFADCGAFLLVSGEDFSQSISVVTVREYKELDEVKQWLAGHNDELQCVVSECVEHPRRVSFGCAQHPQLTDYADAVDVMSFLSRL